MQFTNSVIELMQKRMSVRTYSPRKIEQIAKEKLKQCLSERLSSPWGGTVRFELVELPKMNPKEKKRLGTYGFIQGAQNFIVGASEKSPYDLEHFGFVMEKVILCATELGLSTCWVGGTLKRNRFADQINTTDNETVPAISPIGYAAENRSKIDKLAKWAARSENRRPWETLFFESEFKRVLSREKAGKYEIPLEMIQIAPSASNRQPWRVIKEIDTNNFHFFILRKRSWYSRFLVWPDFPRMDLGIAACHFHLATQELGLDGSWKFMQSKISIPVQFQYIISWISN
ncbi:MAG: nitroreductase family protein [Candidatus Heimdallarchaeota archaeon]|nr:MAG: nitroreductase family protein [Candidatus Heimdallarchaeota archaeon]